MSKPCRRHSAEFKAKVALEALKGLKTAQELARDYQVHPTQINQWKKQLGYFLFFCGDWRFLSIEENRLE
jgi:transposase-like protein